MKYYTKKISLSTSKHDIVCRVNDYIVFNIFANKILNEKNLFSVKCGIILSLI